MLNWIKRRLGNNDLQWEGPVVPEPRVQCPCCDYISLAERGSYQICPVCFWEDDGQDVDELDAPSGPNHGLTLRQGRRNFHDFGAYESDMAKYVLLPEQRSRFRLQERQL
ncbi:CPCC family cysteine-rich protein [Marinobacter zhejiangensis]|uniref:Cysteine-rich CPCC n=1 Tax=Marinobacter zhejiangensis TaxID=488535 RepID=A0A1I4SUZ7_9GAMM|nr:CPCC family cysteine-rich protein [Marinobacter zhejiangensis]SFM68316.1 Cysteine-rich CPCC [Marinobacter zhejiangensis]